MNIIRAFAIAVALFLLSTSMISAQDLSKYRNFSLGAHLADVSKQINETPADVTIIHKTPALIQEMTWWPVPSNVSPSKSEPVEEIRFSFYNGELYRIAATYNNVSTQGLTPEDMVKAISTQYGAATLAVVEANPPASVGYSNMQKPIASWQDSQNSLTLSRSPLSTAFQLVLYSKQLNGQADAAIAEASQQERDDAPQLEAARAKTAADELETERQNNLKTFHP
jgi:hypothetical protein